MRVIMFPGKGNENENRYIDILVDALSAAGIEVQGWDKEFSRQTGDIFHVHWPDVISDIRARKWQTLRGDWIQIQFFRTIRRIQSRGGALVWTGYWERSGGSPAESDADKGVLEEGPIFPTPAEAVAWGQVRTPRIVVVDADGGLTWAGEGEPPEGIPARWQG